MAGEEPGEGASFDKSSQQQGWLGTEASRGEGFQEQWLPEMGNPSDGDSTGGMVGFNTTSRTQTLVHLIRKNCKWMQLN